MKTQKPWRSLAAGSIGNFGELYDFAVFGFSVPILAIHFFPGSNRAAAILSTFAVYAVAFLARPLGGLLFGMLADKIGRVKVMATTVWLMALGTALMGLLPTYQEIGLAAPILLVACRFAQGLAVGGETSGSTSYIVEAAPTGKRGQWLGITLVFSHLPQAFAALALLGLQSVAGSEAYTAWLWRVPFLFGGLIGVVGFWLRRSVSESNEFEQAASNKKTNHPLREVMTLDGLKSMRCVFLVEPIYSVGAYLLIGFMYTFLVRVVKLDPLSALFSNAAAIVVLAMILPVGGMLSDRFGRKPVLSIGALWVAFAAYPAIHMASLGTLSAAVAGQILFAIGLGLSGGASFVAAPEFFPTSYRATGHAISYQLSVAIFGGTCPFIAALLTQYFDSPLAPSFYVAAIATVCLIGTQFVPETKGVALRTSIESTEDDSIQSAVHDVR
jgi:MFS transporter, MHS family, proline/betaine transporter